MKKANIFNSLAAFLNHQDRRNFIIYSLGAFFLKGVSFFLIPLYTNLLSAEEMGQYDLLRNFGAVTEIILSLGLLQLIYAEFYNTGKDDKIKLVGTFLSIYTYLSGFLYILLGIVMFFLENFFLPSVKFILIVLMLATTYLNFYQVILITVLKLTFKALEVSILQLTMGITSLALNIILVYGIRTGIDGIILSGLIVTILSCVYGLYYFQRQLKKFRLYFSWSEFRQYLKLSMPFIPNVLSFWLMNSANRWILLHYSGIKEVGIYSVAARLTAVLEPLIIDPFLSAYIPATLKSLREKIFRQRFLILFLIVPLVFLIAGIFLQFFGTFIIGPEFTGSLLLIIPLSLAYSFNLVAQSAAAILMYAKRIRLMLLCVLGGSIASIIVNFFLVETYDSLGSAWGTLAGNLVWAASVTAFAVFQLKRQDVTNDKI